MIKIQFKKSESELATGVSELSFLRKKNYFFTLLV